MHGGKQGTPLLKKPQKKRTLSASMWYIKESERFFCFLLSKGVTSIRFGCMYSIVLCNMYCIVCNYKKLYISYRHIILFL